MNTPKHEVLKKIKNMLYQGFGVSHHVDRNNISHIEAKDEKGFAYGMGYIHAKQRGLQLGLIQLILRGQLNEFLGDDEELVATDEFMEQFAFHYQARREVSHLKEQEFDYLQAYIDGVNEARRQHYPIELKLLKVPILKWTMADSLALLKLMAFLGLAESQLDAEKFIAQSLAKGVSYKYLRSLFHPHMPEKCPTDLALFPQIKFSNLVIPENYFFKAIPALKNSNNWVTRKQKNDVDGAMAAFDPHLEVNRLPAVWFECVWNSLDEYSMGITLPGVPGFIMGRNSKLCFSFTYGFMDTFDYFIETVKDGLVIQDQSRAGINSRKVSKKSKSGSESTVFVFSTDRGILEVPTSSISTQGNIKDGVYLSRAWSGFQDGASQAIKVLRLMHKAQNTNEACELAKTLFISANWLFCDIDNNIAYQQSGYLPKRSPLSRGLVALDASRERNYWLSHKSESDLITIHNPPENYLCTANNAIQGSDQNRSITLPMADYRNERIKYFLKKGELHSYQLAKAMQSDLYSIQAQKYIEVLKDLIPDTPNGRLLREWDLCYDENSIAASLFENFLSRCYSTLMAPIIGQKAWRHFSEETQLLADYYGQFDRILLNPQEKDRDLLACSLSPDKSGDSQQSITSLSQGILKVCLEKTLSNYPSGTISPWGKKQKFTFSHILLGKKAPRWLPINQGPFPLVGSRSTINQGNIFNHRGRVSTFAPSYRFITSMADDFAFTILPGGPSDRFWSNSYKNEIKLWRQFQYKTIRPAIEPF